MNQNLQPNSEQNLFPSSFDGHDFSDNYLMFQGAVLNNNNNKAIGSHGKVSSADKALIALRNHSEAERRRRERINTHLATLRTLIPGDSKMDKAALLGEVINKVKELKRGVAEATNGTVLLVPTDTDEVKVEEHENNDKVGASFSIRASLCCDFKHQLLADLRQAIESLPLKTIQAEIATLGSRMVNVFLITPCNEEDAKVKDEEGCLVVVNTIRQALKSVLDKFYASEELSSGNSLHGKRRKVSFPSPSNSHSFGDIW